jgi:hypothetical protein
MYCYTPNPIFSKVFHAFLAEPSFKNDLMTLFEGPLRDIAFNFIPSEFRYRGITYDKDPKNALFKLLLKNSDIDPDIYNPTMNIWIAGMM